MTTAATPRDAHEQHTRAPGHAGHKADRLARLTKIECQMGGISRMVIDDRACIDVLTQITADGRALQEVALGLPDDHVRARVTNAARTDPTQTEEKFSELTGTLPRALRL
ncbi:metal-sensitive transcriptional regulator [Streptomyces sp. NPDC101165]|uniref:metal-sensitive transcriptional regulator n=1 Tax=Streptomyces sp. NPDC101165 TaxID=3366119 RepID=UPI003813E6B9